MLLTVVLNGVTYGVNFGANAAEKAAALQPWARRAPERTLHLLALFGALPQALPWQ